VARSPSKDRLSPKGPRRALRIRSKRAAKLPRKIGALSELRRFLADRGEFYLRPDKINGWIEIRRLKRRTNEWFFWGLIRDFPEVAASILAKRLDQPDAQRPWKGGMRESWGGNHPKKRKTCQ